MKVVISLLALLLSTTTSFAQASKLELPMEGDKIVYSRNFTLIRKSNAAFSNLTISFKNDPALKVVRADEKKLEIEATGEWLIPVFRSRDKVTFRIIVKLENGSVQVRFQDFFNQTIGASVEDIIEKNKDSDRDLVQENLKFLKAGIHSRVSEWMVAIKKQV